MRRAALRLAIGLYFSMCGESTMAADPAAPNLHPGGGCPKNVDFEQAGYRIGKSNVYNPFDFLPWVHAQDEAVREQISRLVDGQPYRLQLAVSQAFDILDDETFFPEVSLVKVKIQIDKVEAVNCSGKTLNLVYHVYTSQVLPGSGGTPEQRVEARQTPQNTAGIATGSSGAIPGLRLVPRFGFDSTDKLYSGGQLILPLCAVCKVPVQFMAEGSGSQTMQSFHARIQGSKDSNGPVQHSDFAANYTFTSLPTGSGEIRHSLASVQYSGISAPFLRGNMSARFGGLLEKGDAQATLTTSLPAGASTATALNSLKVYGGLNTWMPHHVLSASFGLQLGTTDVADGVQWKRYIGDVHHDFWYNVAGRHIVDLDSRLTAGAIQASSPFPVAERFFGGNYEQLFIPNDSWQIRANPVIRAIPGSRFYQTAAGAGADTFLSYNLTTAFSVWQKPLVPLDVRSEILDLLNAQIDSLTSIQQLRYAAMGPDFQKMVNELPLVTKALATLDTAVSAAQRAHPNQFTAQFKACASAIRMANNRAKAAMTSDAQQYARISALLKADKTEDRLSKVVQKCDQKLNAALDAQSKIDVGPVKTEQDALEKEYAVLQGAATAKAKAEMLPVHRILNTLFNDVNLLSVSPVAVFDVAEIGPTATGLSGTRYGPGAGVRLELASSAHFTVGYARNVAHRGPGEGKGAVFFEIGFRDLFH